AEANAIHAKAATTEANVYAGILTRGTSTLTQAQATAESNYVKTYIQPGGAADANQIRYAANAAASGSDPNTVAGRVWDIGAAQHATGGTMGALLGAAGGAADPLLNAVPGSYADGTAGKALGSVTAIKAKTDLIATGGAVTIISAVAATGNATITAGTDYKAADGRALTWTDVPWTGPILHDGNATLAMKIIPYATWKAGTAASVLTVTVTATSTGAGKVTLSADMTAAQTAALAPRPPSTSPTHVFQIVATITGGSQIHVLQGMMTVILGIN
ncbi:MAG: hypothetical protein IMZ65_03970, partial [Planctomycetes bacterium]|nr:hypothetical protein [Planctomycetota bacterium]